MSPTNGEPLVEPVPRSVVELSSKVNVLNDETYRWDCATVFSYVILWTNRIRCALNKEILIYSTRKAILERAVVELVYKFDEKSAAV